MDNTKKVDITPLINLKIKTPRLELRLPNALEVDELARLASKGIQDEGREYYNADWLHVPYPANKDLFSKWIENDRENWQTDNWSLGLAAFLEGKPIGMQHIFSRNFSKTQGFGTGVWLGMDYRGNGFGTEMGQAILYLGFEKLGAEEAYAGAWEKNIASIRILEKLGYIPNGQYRELLNDQCEVNLRFRLPRQIWENTKSQDKIIEGLDKSLPLFGLYNA